MYVLTIRDLIADYLVGLLTGLQQEFVSGTTQQQGATGRGNFTFSKGQGAQIGQLQPAG